MAENTKIEWCDSTFNPWVGCTKVGPGCDHCYAEGWAKRSGSVQWGPGAERRRTADSNWRKPLQWNAQPFVECTACGWRGEKRDAHWGGSQCPKCRGQESLKPARRRVFCASLADVFDNEVPVEWRADLFDLIAQTPHLDWLLVTKRIGNAKAMMADALHLNPAALFNGQIWLLPNVWLGITVVNQAEADRDVPKLLQLKASVRFLSIEPLLGGVDLSQWLDLIQYDDGGPWMRRNVGHLHDMLDWVIVGGESGPKARPMHPQWARDIRDQCAAAGVPFLFKQWGEWAPASHGHGGKHGAWNGDAFLPGFGDIKTPDNNMTRAGKNACGGRLLDGREHNGFPEVPHA